MLGATLPFHSLSGPTILLWQVLTAEQSTNFTPPPCPVATCTSEMQIATVLTCRVPHLDSSRPHAVTLATVIGGYAVAPSPNPTVTTPPQLRAISPISGSVAGGMRLTLSGDGFSTSRRDVEVSLGGRNCRVISTNATTVLCATPAASRSGDSSATAVVHVRGVAVSCNATSSSLCDYSYSIAKTPRLTSATVLSKSPTEWSIELSGSFGDGSAGGALSLDTAEIRIGESACVMPPGENASASTLACVSPPPLSGNQVVTLTSKWGRALGAPVVVGTPLTATSFTPTLMSLAGESSECVDRPPLGPMALCSALSLIPSLSCPPVLCCSTAAMRLPYTAALPLLI